MVTVGTHRLGDALARVRAAGRKALVPYLMLGDPDLETSIAVGRAFAEAGADVIELGLPFSDPMADGPVIQAAGNRALAGGLRVADALEAVARLRAEVSCPLALMCYVNLVYARGYDGFAAAAAAAGADGLVIPDIPVEESPVLATATRGRGMDLVLFVAPTSTEERIRAVAAAASGFVYCVSVAGVTGARADTLARVPETVRRVRHFTDLPLLVGFGINSPEKAAGAVGVADGVIVASWIVDALAQLGPDGTPSARARLAGGMVAELRAAIDGVASRAKPRE